MSRDMYDFLSRIEVSDQFERRYITMNWRGFMELRHAFDRLAGEASPDGETRGFNISVGHENNHGRPEAKLVVAVYPDGNLPNLREMAVSEIDMWKHTAQSVGQRLLALERQVADADKWHAYPEEQPDQDKPYLLRCTRGTKILLIEGWLGKVRNALQWRSAMGPINYRVTHFRSAIVQPADQVPT